jgi:hypothetical protein
VIVTLAAVVLSGEIASVPEVITLTAEDGPCTAMVSDARAATMLVASRSIREKPVPVKALSAVKVLARGMTDCVAGAVTVMA